MATALRIVPYTTAWNVGDGEYESTAATPIDFEVEEVVGDSIKFLQKTVMTQLSQKQPSFYYDTDVLGASPTLGQILKLSLLEYYGTTHAKIVSLFNSNYTIFDIYLNYIEDINTKTQFVLSLNRKKVYSFGASAAFISHALTFYRSE